MTLAELLMPIERVSAEGNLDVDVSAITDDSRDVMPGGVFVAVKGQRTDGHAFVEQACRQGAGGVVVQAPFRVPVRCAHDAGPAWITVNDSRKALGRLAARFFRNPSKTLTVVGVTGTNGKTTVTHVSQAILSSGGCRTGLIGTVGYRPLVLPPPSVPWSKAPLRHSRSDLSENPRGAPGACIPAHAGRRAASHTTPGAVPLQSFLHRMVEAGMEAVVLEVSSHALALDRVEGCTFDIVVFTNLTRDHLDFHGDMESYYQTKRRLFRDCVIPHAPTRPKRAIVNIDDDWGVRLAAETSVPVWTCSLRRPADLQARHVMLSLEGTRFTAHTPVGTVEIQTALVGEHNVSNLLAGIGVGLARGLSLPAIQEGIRGFRTVPGRFERVDAGQDFSVIVDYAHTEDALARLLDVARQITTGRLLTVFGCGGDRDRGKRSNMGRVAAQRSDVVFLTSDNPRTEDPDAILRDVEHGVLALAEGARGAWHVIPDRRAAIQAALREARTGDMVVIAGKGHEDYQIIGDTRHHFDDRVVARELLSGLSKRQPHGVP